MLPPEEKLRLLSMVDIQEPLTREEIEELSILVPDTHFQRARQQHISQWLGSWAIASMLEIT